jgi:hypothetical protein
MPTTAILDCPCCGESGSGAGSGSGCAITGWAGAGFYCIVVGTYCVAVELLAEDECDTSLTICSGPYATLAAAQAACGLVTTDCCDIPRRLFVTIVQADECCYAVGDTTEIVYTDANPLDKHWEGTHESAACSPLVTYFKARCAGSSASDLEFSYGCNDPGNNYSGALGITDCTNIDVTINLAPISACCSESGVLKVRLTSFPP